MTKQSVADLGILRDEVARAATRGARDDLRQPDHRPRLTDTQIETMRLIAEGLTNAEIAQRRFVTEKSVEVEADAVVVRIADDGQGPRGGAAGFGSAVLNEATGGDWSIAPGPTGGAVVTARLPLPAAG